jgi:hypothetical protein
MSSGWVKQFELVFVQFCTACGEGKVGIFGVIKVEIGFLENVGHTFNFFFVL